MEDFYVSIKSSLLEKKHMAAMGSSIWLYMWLLDKVTKIDKEGYGVVLGGKPVKHEEFKKNLDLSKRTYARYIQQLELAGYVKTLRTPYGLVIRVAKAKKFFANTEKNARKRYANNGTSPIVKNGTSLTKNGTSLTKFGTSNKTIQLDNTIRQIGDDKYKTPKAQKMPDLSAGFYEQFEMNRNKQNA